METPSRTVGQVFAESLQPNLEAATLATENETRVRRFANGLLDMRLPKLTELYDQMPEGPEKAMAQAAMNDKVRELGDELLQQDGYENRVRWMASNLRDGRIDKRFVDSSFDFIKEAARQPNPELSLETAKAFASGLLPAAGDFFTGVYGVARYAPQAAFETLKEGKIEEINRVLNLIGKEPIKQDDTPATKLSAYAALQGTYETGRLLQRVARTIADTEKDFTDEALRARFNEDIDLYDTIVSIERGQTKQRDPETGKYVQVVPEDLVPNIAPMGEVLSIDNAASFGAGLAAKKASQAVAKNVLKKRVAAAPRLMTAADIELAEAAERAALQSSIPLSQRALGRTMEAAGRAAETVAGSPLVRGTVAGTGTTLGTGSPMAGVVAGVAAATSPRAKQVATMVPGAVRRTGEKIATTPVTGTTAKALKIFGDTAKGALAGAATMAAPALFVGETPEEVGTLIAGGAAFGAGGSAVGQVKSGIDSLGRSLWRPDTKSVPESARVAPSSYGVPELDSQHANYVSQLPANQANRVEALRKLIGKQNQLFVLSPEAYDAIPETQSDTGAKSKGVFFKKTGDNSMVALVRGGSDVLIHEVGHIVFESLPEQTKNRVLDSVVEGYTPEEIAAMADYYSQSGINLPDQLSIAKEIIAENYQVALNGGPLGRLGTPLGLAGEIYSTLGQFAERLNLRNLVPGADVVTSEELQFTPSFIVQKALRNALEAANNDPGVSIPTTAPAPAPAPAPAAATPAPAPTPTPTLTPEAAAPAAPAAPAPAPVAPTAPEAAVAVPEVSQTPATTAPARPTPIGAPKIYAKDEQRENIGTRQATPEVEAENKRIVTEEVAKPRSERRPIQIDYNSAKVEESNPSPSIKLTEPQRAKQRALADAGEAEGIGDLFREVYDKVTVPYKVQETKKGGLTTFAFSLDKVIRNIDMLGAWLRRNPTAAQNIRQVTGVDSLSSPEFRDQFQAYLTNQANGYRGDGKPLVKTEDTRAEDIPDPTPGYTPTPVPEGAAKLINSLMGVRNPVDYGANATAAQSYVQRLAKANGAALVETVPTAGGKPSAEFNTVNKALRDNGFDTQLFHVAIEQLRLNRVVSPVKFRDDLSGVRAPLQGAIQAGFAPALAPDTPEFKRWFGKSKVVDDQGKPMVMFHGTDAPDFTVFRPNPALGGAIFVSPSAEYANMFTGAKGSRVYPVFVKAEKTYPRLIRWGDNEAAKLERAKELGYDSARVTDGGKNPVINLAVFDPTQIKSATGNTGAFSPTNPDIRYAPSIQPEAPLAGETTVEKAAPKRPLALPTYPIGGEEHVREIDSLGQKNAPQTKESVKNLKYPLNPLPDSVTLPPRWGLVNRNIVGMARSYAEVLDVIDRVEKRLETVMQDSPEFARESARFYRDMADSSLIMVDVAFPDERGLSVYEHADLMLRFLALGSPRTDVSGNATKSSGSAAGAASGFTPGYKLGFTSQQLGAKETFNAWRNKGHFDLEATPGVDDKVRSFYLNGVSELIEIAQERNDVEAETMLLIRAAESLNLTEPGTKTLTPELKAETMRQLDGKATVDMWDMAGKGFAWPGFILRKSERNKASQPFQWSQDKFAKKAMLGDTAWKTVQKDLGITDPSELRYQEARSLRIDGNSDWTRNTWAERIKQPFPPLTEFTYFTQGTEAGLTPGGGGPLYDAQQAMDGLVADRLNAKGLAPQFGKTKLKARNAQEILWALEKLDNPIEANNDLSLFGNTFKSLQTEIGNLRLGKGVTKKTRAEAVLAAMDRAYAAMAMQQIPFEVITSGRSPAADTIRGKLEQLTAAGVPNPVVVLTDYVADGLGDVINDLATNSGLDITVDRVMRGEGGYTEGDVVTSAPNTNLVVRGNIEDVRNLNEIVARALDQDGANVFRKPTVQELNDANVKKSFVVTFDTRGLTPVQRNAFFLDLADLRDDSGNRFLTGFTEVEDGIAIGDQFYDGDMAAQVDRKISEIKKIMDKYDVPRYRPDRLIVSTFKRGTPETELSQTPFARDLTKYLMDRVVAAGQSSTAFPQETNAPSLLRRRAETVVATPQRTATARKEELTRVASAVDAAVLRGVLDEVTAKDIKGLLPKE